MATVQWGSTALRVVSSRWFAVTRYFIALALGESFPQRMDLKASGEVREASTGSRYGTPRSVQELLMRRSCNASDCTLSKAAAVLLISFLCIFSTFLSHHHLSVSLLFPNYSTVLPALSAPMAASSLAPRVATVAALVLPLPPAPAYALLVITVPLDRLRRNSHTFVAITTATAHGAHP